MSSSKTILPLTKKLNDYRFILASGSPRRKELLSVLGITKFDVLTSKFEENLDKKQFATPQDYCLETAKSKLRDIISTYSDSVLMEDKPTFIIGADTIVTYEGLILEKPKDKEEAKKMISILNNKTHQVATAVVIYTNFNKKSEEEEENEESKLKKMKSTNNYTLASSFVEITDVKFSSLTEEDIEAYAETGEGLDKAGSYGIQGLGGQLVESIQGCYFNVMGLPIHKLSSAIAKIINENK